MSKILLIRHALTDTAGIRLSGRTPGVFLNTEGKRQAKRLAEKLATTSIDAIYTSPLERALETANSIAAFHQISPVVSGHYMEIDFGRWTNCEIEELKNDPLFDQFNKFRSTTRIPEGELMTEAQLRIIQGLEQIPVLHPGKTVVIVSHADMIKSAVAYYAGIHLDLFHRIEISPASISIIELDRYSVSIQLLNNT